MIVSVKVRVTRPLDPHSWEQVGPRLRELSAAAHRILNRAATCMTVMNELPDSVPDEWKSDSGKPGEYQIVAAAVRREFGGELRWSACKWCGGNGVEPNAPPTDKRGKAVPRGKRQRDVEPGEPCSKCYGKGGKNFGHDMAIPSDIISGWSRAVGLKMRAERKDVMAGRRSIPSYRSPAPIMWTSSGTPCRVMHDGRGYVLDVPLGGEVGRVALALGPDGPNAFAHMRKLVAPGTKLGDVKLLAPKPDAPEHKRHWLAVISYHAEDIPLKGSGGDVVLHRGMRAFLTALAQDGRCKTLCEGDMVRRVKLRHSARRRSLGRHMKDLAPGARGHGETRRREHILKAEDAESRWVKSICQETASKAVKFAVGHGAKRIIIEQYSTPYDEVDERQGSWVRHWPWFRLKEAIAWAAKKAGLELLEVPGSYITQLCPRCGVADGGNVNRRSFKFQCLKCDFRHQIDAVACMNMLPQNRDIISAASAAQKGIHEHPSQ